MSACLDLDGIRALAEEPQGDPAGAAHVATCARCARKVEQARGEEAALRAALPIDPPKGLLEQTLAAVRADGASARTRRRARPERASNAPLVIGLVLGALALGAGGLLLRPRPAPTPGAPPPPPSTARPTPPTPPRATETPSAHALTEPIDPEDPWSEPEPEPEPEPEHEHEHEHEKTEPESGPVVVQATETEPGTSTTTEPRPALFARVRRGKVDVKGRALGPGAALASGDPLRALGGPAEVEVPGSVTLVLAARTTLGLEAQGDGVAVRLERGRLLARTAGPRPWGLVTDEGRADPVGTALLALREGSRTRLSTVEGLVRVSAGDDRVDLRPGFEVELARGRAPEARPLAAPGKALGWLPDDLRPAAPAAPEALVAHAFEDGRGRWTKGTPRAGGARGSRGCLVGVPGAPEYAASVELEALAGVVTIDPDLWLEASVQVDRPATVALQVWDYDRKENLALITPVEAGRWTTVAGPLRLFTGPSGEARGPVVKGGRGTCVTVLAGEPGQALELLVDDVRFWRQP